MYVNVLEKSLQYIIFSISYHFMLNLIIYFNIHQKSVYIKNQSEVVLMKKVLMLLCAGIIACTVCACGGGEATSDNTNVESTETSSQLAE